ncbi:MAG: hypothetical protein Q4C47_04780, partial [Planctomycetia bacterium]|nr:hypothetical protein [Planctomycetia bacterium]
MKPKRSGMSVVLVIGISIVVAIGKPACAENGATVYVEAERFAEIGGWSVDSQFLDQMGSTFLIAHGTGTPVEDAVTEVSFPESGVWYVWVRTRNWVSPWTFPEGVNQMDEVGGMDSGTFADQPVEIRQRSFPGAFQISVNGEMVSYVFGTRDREWTWESGGAITIERTDR